MQYLNYVRINRAQTLLADNTDGVPTEPPCKGHTYKGPFHVMRMLAKCLVLMKDMK